MYTSFNQSQDVIFIKQLWSIVWGQALLEVVLRKVLEGIVLKQELHMF